MKPETISMAKSSILIKLLYEKMCFMLSLWLKLTHLILTFRKVVIAWYEVARPLSGNLKVVATSVTLLDV